MYLTQLFTQQHINLCVSLLYYINLYRQMSHDVSVARRVNAVMSARYISL